MGRGGGGIIQGAAKVIESTWLEVERFRKEKFKSLVLEASVGRTGQGRASGSGHSGRGWQREQERGSEHLIGAEVGESDA